MLCDANVFFFCFFDGARLRRRDILAAIVTRLPEIEQRYRITRYGAVRVALNEFDWLLNRGGARTLLDPPVEAFLVTVRRPDEAPVLLTPVDLIRCYRELGWVPENQRAQLPHEALKPATEDDAITLDQVRTRYQPSSPEAHLTRAAILRERSAEIAADIQARVAARTMGRGAVAGSGDGGPKSSHLENPRPGGTHGPS